MFRKFFIIAVCLMAAVVTTNAQSNYAVVRGSVLDQQHHAVPGAHIQVREDATGAQREVVSNATGLYEIAGLQPGKYTLTVDGQGFAQTTQTIDLEVGQQATIDLGLRVSSDKQTVNVEGSGELLKTLHADLAKRHPSVGVTRAIGLFGIIELVRNRQTMEPMAPINGTSPEMAALGKFFRDEGLFTFVRWNSFFTNPPLCVTEEELREGIAIIDRALESTDKAVQM